MVAAARMVEVEVARGRTVFTPGVPLEVKLGGVITMQSTQGKNNGPGSKLRVTEDEAKHLRAEGFVFDPDAPVIPVAEGPNLTSADGPSFQQR
jgi:hypothetical protein